MDKINVSHFKSALADREKLAAGRVPGQSTGVRVGPTNFEQAAQSRFEAAKFLGGGFLPSVEMVNKPYFYSMTSADMFVDESIAPGNSWVKINIDDQGQDTAGRLDRLIFYYLWQNPFASPTVVDVSAYMTVSGSWETRADVYAVHVRDEPGDPNYDPGDSRPADGSAHLGLSANMALYQWWNEPPTLAQLENAPDQRTRIDLLDQDLHALNTDPDIKSGFMFNWFELKQNLLVIPAEGMLVAEVSFDVDHKVNHGRAWADFADGDGNQITSHWLQVAYVLAPPGVTLTPVVQPSFAQP